MASASYYLGKSGKITGPFTGDEIEELRRSGGLAAYSWIRAEGAPAWEALDPPPALPAGAGAAAAPPQETARAPAPAYSARPSTPREPVPTPRAPSYYPCDLEALCHDQRSVVTGRLARVTDHGCELVSPERTPAPRLASRARATLNLLDPGTGRAVNVTVRLGTASRRGDTWVYPVRWSSCPSLIAGNSAA